MVGLGGNSFNLCLAVDKQRLPRERQVEFLSESLLPQNPYLRELLLSSRRVGEARATYPVYFKPRRCLADGILFIGDAARVNEPVSGEGIYFAMKSALLAAETIDEAFGAGDFSATRLRSYERRCRREFKLRRRTQHAPAAFSLSSRAADAVCAFFCETRTAARRARPGDLRAAAGPLKSRLIERNITAEAAEESV